MLRSIVWCLLLISATAVNSTSVSASGAVASALSGDITDDISGGMVGVAPSTRGTDYPVSTLTAAEASEADALVSFAALVHLIDADQVRGLTFVAGSELVQVQLVTGVSLLADLADGPEYALPTLMLSVAQSGVLILAPPDATQGGSGDAVLWPLGVLILALGLIILARQLHRRRLQQRTKATFPVVTSSEVAETQQAGQTHDQGASPNLDRLGRRREADQQDSRFNPAMVAVPSTRFGDVAGCEEAVEDLRELVEFLRDPERFERLGAKIPRGALLAGPPGTGKTLLARAVAGEAGVGFFAHSGSDFTDTYVGVGAKRIRELFAAAREADRAIVFIDEIDALARARAGSGQRSGGNEEHENTLIALLNELDGFVSNRVILIAATNRPDVLDPALLRPGRLDRKVEVPNPDRRGREAILAVHTRCKPLAADVDLELMSRRSAGMSGAELSAIANEAALEAVRRDLTEITQSCFDAAVELVAMGRPRLSAVVTRADRQITAWHEAGHCLAALVEPDAPDPVAVSIVPRGPAGGVTWMSAGDEQFLSRQRANAQLVVALAGRAAEELALDGEFTQGAYGDLRSATDLATAMATRYGMTRLGLMVRDPDPLGGQDALVAEVVEELLSGALDRARTLLVQHRELLDDLVSSLLAEDSLDARRIAELAFAHGIGAGYQQGSQFSADLGTVDQSAAGVLS